MRLGSAEEGRQANSRDRGDGAAEPFDLGDHARQGPADDLAQVLGVQPPADAHRPRKLGEQHAHQPALFLSSDAAAGGPALALAARES